jgi:uncharacterized surface protein with fasciclin (FAS1) repeats
MKKLAYIIFFIVLFLGFYSCNDKESKVTFKDQEEYTIYDFVVANKKYFSSFLSIMEKGGIDKILSAYNPENNGYTLFLPDNNAIAQYIQESGKYSSLEDLLNDTEFVVAMARYHVVRQQFKTDDFPFGAFSKTTLSDDYLTVSFISEIDTAYFKINNQAPVTVQNIETSNGYIHVIGKPLLPVINTTYDWLAQNSGFSIFKAAADLTGFNTKLDINLKDESYTGNSITLLLEHDSIYHKKGINNVQDLINYISPSNSDYTNNSNPLYNYVGYHILDGGYFLNYFETKNSNYNTYSDVPVRIADMGMALSINYGREKYDTIVSGTDTTYIEYIGFNYDASNVITQSGAIHIIDHVMTQKSPSVASQYYSFFWDEPILYAMNQSAGSYIVDDTAALKNIRFKGNELLFVAGETSLNAWDNNYLSMDGNFSFKYTLPKIVQGTYMVRLRADFYSQSNGVVQVFIDGKNVGGTVDLTKGGSATDPFYTKALATFTFVKYESHTIEIKSLIPGQFLLDVIIFDTNLLTN